MHIEIDQSGKIENTSKDTVVAFSNKICRSILLPARDKRVIQTAFRSIGKPRVFVYKTFALLIFLLIKPYVHKITTMVIDTEYPGWEHLIKDYLLREMRRVRPGFNRGDIVFARIGKKSRAHKIAYRVARREKLADEQARDVDVLQYVMK